MDELSVSVESVSLTCRASRPRPDVCVVHLAGELDMATTPHAAEYLRRHTATRPAELVVDLGGVTLLAAAGAEMIVTALNGEGGIHGRLHLTGVTGNRPVERVLRLTGLMPLLDVHENVQRLVDSLSGE